MYTHPRSTCTYTCIYHVHTPVYCMYTCIQHVHTPVYFMYTHLSTACTCILHVHMPVYFMYIHLYTACAFTCILHIQTEYTLSCNKSKIVQISSKRKWGVGGGDGEYHIENNPAGGDGEYQIKKTITHTNLQSAAERAYKKQHTHTQKHSKMFLKSVYNIGGSGGRGGERTIRDAQMR